SPDIVLSIESEPPNLYPYAVFESSQTLSKEITDWGIADLNIEPLWLEDRAKDGVVVGFLDAGFGRHEDITFTPFRTTTKRSNHGNHVAGIACASHNGVGVKGVVPNCFVDATADPFITYEAAQNSILEWQTTFAQILDDLNTALEVEGVKVYNVSLGYNWMSNFNIDTGLDNANARFARNVARSQGIPTKSFYKVAATKDKIIYSAGGNDSYEGKISAKFASPFNWAAIDGRGKG
ncbi:unnamed protein product, partial [Chrysoparadoxa australica]